MTIGLSLAYQYDKVFFFSYKTKWDHIGLEHFLGRAAVNERSPCGSSFCSGLPPLLCHEQVRTLSYLDVLSRHHVSPAPCSASPAPCSASTPFQCYQARPCLRNCSSFCTLSRLSLYTHSMNCPHSTNSGGCSINLWLYSKSVTQGTGEMAQ